jgi:alkaline phosphatase D
MPNKNTLLGPIFGYTTQHFSTLWVKGRKGWKATARWKAESTGNWQKKTLNLNPLLDFTGITQIFFPIAKQPITVEILFYPEAASDPEVNDERWTSQNVEILRGRVRPAPASDAEFCFIAGSCSHRGYGLGRKGGEAFRTILENDSGTQGVVHAELADFILMMGDQVYADHPINDLVPFIPWIAANNPPNSTEGYFVKYRHDFSNISLRNLMATLPVYMILDDHEVENNWGGYLYREKREKKSMFNIFKKPENRGWNPKILRRGLISYLAYQASHSPLFPPDSGDSVNKRLSNIGVSTPHWGYKFSNGLADYLVLDGRTERSDPFGNDPKMLDEQFDQIELFLTEGVGRYKFIVSPVPIAPDTNHDDNFDSTKILRDNNSGFHSDTWRAYPEQRNKLLHIIRNAPGLRPILLSGDLHVSCMAEINCTIADESELVAVSLVSSAFNWITFGTQPESKKQFLLRKLEQGVLPEDLSQLAIAPESRPGSFTVNIVNQSCPENNYMLIHVSDSSVKAEIFRACDGELHSQWTIDRSVLEK